MAVLAPWVDEGGVVLFIGGSKETATLLLNRVFLQNYASLFQNVLLSFSSDILP